MNEWGIVMLQNRLENRIRITFMKITGIDTFPIAVAVDRRVGQVEDTKRFRFTSHLVVILIRTDVGIEWVGEVNGSPDWSGETYLGAKALIALHLAPRLIGEDPRRIRYCMAKIERTFGNPFAKAGIEMALFDILGKSLNTLLYQLLGSAVRSFDLLVPFANYAGGATGISQGRPMNCGGGVLHEQAQSGS